MSMLRVENMTHFFGGLRAVHNYNLEIKPGEVAGLTGASGIGTTASQLCGLFGHPCFVTVGSQEKLETCLRLGADAGWNRHDGSFVEAVNDWGGADMILDPVGGGYLADPARGGGRNGRLWFSAGLCLRLFGPVREDPDHLHRERVLREEHNADPD